MTSVTATPASCSFFPFVVDFDAEVTPAFAFDDEYFLPFLSSFYPSSYLLQSQDELWAAPAYHSTLLGLGGWPWKMHDVFVPVSLWGLSNCWASNVLQIALVCTWPVHSNRRQSALFVSSLVSDSVWEALLCYLWIASVDASSNDLEVQQALSKEPRPGLNLMTILLPHTFGAYTLL